MLLHHLNPQPRSKLLVGGFRRFRPHLPNRVSLKKPCWRRPVARRSHPIGTWHASPANRLALGDSCIDAPKRGSPRQKRIWRRFTKHLPINRFQQCPLFPCQLCFVPTVADLVNLLSSRDIGRSNSRGWMISQHPKKTALAIRLRPLFLETEDVTKPCW